MPAGGPLRRPSGPNGHLKCSLCGFCEHVPGGSFLLAYTASVVPLQWLCEGMKQSQDERSPPFSAAFADSPCLCTAEAVRAAPALPLEQRCSMQVDLLLPPAEALEYLPGSPAEAVHQALPVPNHYILLLSPCRSCSKRWSSPRGTAPWTLIARASPSAWATPISN